MVKQSETVMLDISWQALYKLVAMAVLIWLALTLRDIIFMVAVVFIFVAAVNPTIRNLQQHMTRTLAVALFFTIMALVFGLISYLIIPQFISQLNGLIQQFPRLIDEVKPYIASLSSQPRFSELLDKSMQELSSGAQQVSGNFYSTVVTFFGGLFTVVTGLILSFYLLLEEKNARTFFHQVLPQHRFEPVYKTVSKISEQLGAWIRGQFTIMLIVGILNVIAFAAVGIPSPLPLGLWSGLCEAIPYIGPVIGVLPGFIVAASGGNLWQIIFVVAVNYVLIQQIQNFYITPKIMGKAVGLSPVLVILAILVGISLFGPVGAIIAIPGAAIVSVVVGEWQNLRTLWEQGS